MPLDERVQSIIEKIEKLRQRLDNVSRQANTSYDFQAGYERLFHWKERAIRFLRENVSTKEADNLSIKGRKEPINNSGAFSQDVNLYDAILVAILEALEDDPSYVLEDVASPSASHLSERTPLINYKYDVFISYSSLDQEQANILYNAVKDAGRQPFLSAKDLAPGQDFAEEIRKQLAASRELWMLVTPNSLRSEWVLTEMGAAWVLEKKIVPILHRCRPDELPDKLRRLHCTDLYKVSDLINVTFKSA